MNDPSPNPQDDPRVVELLEEKGATYKRSKSGKVLLVDLRNASDVDDDLIKELGGLPKLRELNLAGCPVTDDSGPTLRAFTNLRTLELQRTGVSDAILDDLQQSSSLQLLDVTGTKVSIERVRAARKLMIGTRIIHLDG